VNRSRGWPHRRGDGLIATGSFSMLVNEGIHGNGHMVMLEKNNLAVAGVLQKWLVGHVK